MTTDPLQALLGTGLVPDVSLPPSSRYATVGTTTWAAPAAPGEEPVPIAFLRRRLVPPPERYAAAYDVACVEGDRRDLLAAAHLGDPELWWRLADANGVVDPAAMTRPPGRRLRIPADDGSGHG